jgi:hypothetical protein
VFRVRSDGQESKRTRFETAAGGSQAETSGEKCESANRFGRSQTGLLRQSFFGIDFGASFVVQS